MKTRISVLLLLVTGAALNIFAQINLNSSVPFDPNVRVGKLSNGFTYYIRKNTKPEKKAEFRLAVNAGSILERDDQQGFAHFLEHMAFNGTKSFQKNELVSYLQSIGVDFGADLNAYTSFDETVYMLSIPTDKAELLDKGLLIMKEWSSDVTLDPEEVKKEQGVVLEELRLGKGAGQRMRDKYFPKLFYGSSYANRLPIGKKELLSNVNHKALVDFYEEWYRPDLMALVVVGDIDPNEIEAKIKANFSQLKAKRADKKRPVFQIPDHKETFVAIETDKEATGTSLSVYYKKPPTKVKTLADLRQSLVRQFYNQMLNARLDEIRQNPNSPFIGAGASFSSFAREKGAYFMGGSTTPEGIKPTLMTLLTENKRVQDYGFTAAEFERQKLNYLTSLENRFKEKDKTSSYVFADTYVNSFLNQSASSGIEFSNEFAKQVLPTITLDEINALAKNTISDDNRVFIITGVEKAGVTYPTEQEILALVKESASAKVSPYTEKVISEPLVGELPSTAKITEEKPLDKYGISYLTLSNGVKVVLKPTDFKQDEITMRAYSPGGSSLLETDKLLSTSLMTQVVADSGVGKLSKIELDKLLTGKRASVMFGLSDLFETISGTTTPKDFETMLQLTYAKFSGVNFDKAVFDSVLNKQKMFFPTLQANPQIYFSMESGKILNAGNPRYFSPFDMSLFEKANFEDIKTVYKDRFADASDFTFVFVGNFDKEQIRPLLVKYLGNLPSTGRVEKWKDWGYRTPSEKIEKTILKGLDDKSQVQIMFTGETAYDRDEGRDLAALGEFLTIKLIETLREEKSGVYGVNAGGSIAKIPYGRYSFTVSFPCGPENVESLTQAALELIAKTRKGEIDDKDIAKVKEARIVKLKESYKDNSYWHSLINFKLNQGLEVLTLEESEARTEQITKERLQQIAQKYLKVENMKKFVLMPETKPAVVVK